MSLQNLLSLIKLHQGLVLSQIEFKQYQNNHEYQVC